MTRKVLCEISFHKLNKYDLIENENYSNRKQYIQAVALDTVGCHPSTLLYFDFLHLTALTFYRSGSHL